ncbi:MAG: hypothetical protein RL143_760, partial [Pseudomonadota bacterium]
LNHVNISKLLCMFGIIPQIMQGLNDKARLFIDIFGHEIALYCDTNT